MTGEQDPDPPRTFRKIHLEYRLTGRGLSREAVERAIRLSEEKYCSVRATISGITDVTSGYTLVQDEP